MDFENYDKAIQQADTELKKVRQKAENMIGEFKQVASASHPHIRPFPR